MGADSIEGKAGLVNEFLRYYFFSRRPRDRVGWRLNSSCAMDGRWPI